jgi:hypothetical protein
MPSIARAAGIVALSAATLIPIGVPVAGQATGGQPAVRWYKGNTHTHTINSDGDSTPDDVVRWYREHRYQFVVLTDHEFITPVDGLNASFGAPEKFLVISGQEVTGSFDGKPVHVNGINLTRVVMPVKGTSVLDVLQRDVDAVREAGGVPQINHPNFGWGLTAEDLTRVERARLMEIWNGHPTVNNLGGGGSPSAEEIWDTALTGGREIFGVADDDSHYFKRIGDPAAPTPGHGWVVVRAARLDAAAIAQALDRGDFYASTGVELTDYRVTDREITVTIRAVGQSRYRVIFVGAGGKTLAESVTNPAVYTFRGGERYVRARVIESNGAMAWTQPVFRPR